MQFSCESCRAQLQIADEKVKGKQLIVRCRRCGAKIAIADPALARGAPRLVQAKPQGAQPAAPVSGSPLRQKSAPALVRDGEAPAHATQSEPGGNARQAAKPGNPAQNDALGSRPPPPPPSATASDGQLWFAMLQGKQTGPLSKSELEAKIDGAEIGPRTYLWKEGMSAWQRAKDFSELSARFPQPQGPSLPPPLPAAMRSQPEPWRPREAVPRSSGSREPEPRKPASSAPSREPMPKAKEDPSATGAALFGSGLEAASPSPSDARHAAPSGALERKAAELALWASEELARKPRVEEPVPKEPAAPTPGTGSFGRRPPAVLILAALAVLAAAAVALWIASSGERNGLASANRSGPVPSAAPQAQPAGLTPEQIRRRLDENRSALQSCIDDALRHDPRLRVGKIHIATTIGPSGEVIATKIDKSAVDESALGACLKNTTRRIAFPGFVGDAFEVDIPVVVTAGE